jgi:hypothetical protein
MMRLFNITIFALLAASAVAQVPAPQIPLTGNVGVVGSPILNSGIYQMPSDANQTFAVSNVTTSAFSLKITSAVSLTATRTITYPVGRFTVNIENATTGGQALNISFGSGATCSISNGNLVTVWFDGTNCVAEASGGGSGLNQLTGDVSAGPGTGSQAATVLGLKGVLFCTGFTPTNGQAVTLTTTSSPNPCWTGSVQTPNFTSPLYIAGDSTGAGTGADLYANAWAGILMASHASPTLTAGTPSTGGSTGFGNFSRGGNVGGDVADSIAKAVNMNYYPQKPLPVTVIDVGLNDANGCGVTTPCQTAFTNSYGASIALAGMTNTQAHRVLAASMTCTGTWSTGTFGLYSTEFSTTNGDHCNGSVTTTGNPIGVEYLATTGNGGTASCTDGTNTTVITLGSSINVAGNNGNTAVWRTELGALGAGTHAVACTTTSSTGSGNVVTWIGFDTIPSGVKSTLPRIVMTNVTSVGGTNDSATQTFSSLAASIEAAFLSEGANISLADIRTPTNNTNYFNTTSYPSNSDPAWQAGGLHYNDGGHAAVAAAIIANAPDAFTYGIGQSQTPILRGGVPLPSTYYYDNGNATAGYSTTNINPNGWCVYPSSCYDFGASVGEAPPFESPGFPYSRINSGGLCYTFAGGFGQTLQSQFPIAECALPYGHFMYSVTNGGLYPTNSVSHFQKSYPWVTMHDNQVSMPTSGSQLLPNNGDFVTVGPLSAPQTLSLPPCNATDTLGLANIRYTLIRLGSDLNTVTLAAVTNPPYSANETVNGGATWAWTSATAYSTLTLQCSWEQIGGSYWTATPSSSSSGSGTIISGTVDGAAYYSGGTTVSSTTAPTTSGHTFALAWQPSGSAIAPAPLDLATYLASPPAIGGTTAADGSFNHLYAVSGVVSSGVSGVTQGSYQMYASGGGSITLTPASTASTRTVVFPDNGGTVAELNLAQTFSALQTFGANASIASTAHGVLLSEGSSAVVATAVGTTGQCFLGSTGANPGWGACPSTTSLAESSLTGPTAATTITETGTGNAITRAGVETGNLTFPYVFTNSNTTNNNSSGALAVLNTGTSTGGRPFLVSGLSTGGNLQEWDTGCSPSAGVLSGCTNVAAMAANGALTLGVPLAQGSGGTGASTLAGANIAQTVGANPVQSLGPQTAMQGATGSNPGFSCTFVSTNAALAAGTCGQSSGINSSGIPSGYTCNMNWAYNGATYEASGWCTRATSGAFQLLEEYSDSHAIGSEVWNNPCFVGNSVTCYVLIQSTNIQANTAFLFAGTQTTVSCSTSGTAIFAQPEQGSHDKKVLIHLTACLGTASYTYPVAFTNTPSIYASNNVAAGVLTSVSTSAVTVTGATSTGSIFLEDY